MIVRDEAAVIHRCLVSARPHIDRWVIVDTGSDDDTPLAVPRLLHGIPGELHHRPWRDFATNRTELLRLARGAADYLLLLDADQTVHGTLAGADLHADAHLVRHDDDPEMWIPRLLRGDRRWRFEGQTHERLVGEGPWSVERLEGLFVRHHADGGSRGDKLWRDQGLLEDALLADPTDARATFYLAQTYRAMKRPAAAADAYERRVALGGGDEEEIFYAAYQAAALYAEIDPPRGMAQLLDAWKLRPSRVEPLYHLALAHRIAGNHALALETTELAAGIELPVDDGFVHRWMYDWGIPVERAAALGYLGRVDEGLAIVDGLLRTAGLPAWLDVDLLIFRQWLEDRHVQVHGAPSGIPVPLDAPVPAVGTIRPPRPPTLEQLIGEFDTVPVAGELEAPWAPLNPSVAASAEGFGVLLRLTNWRYIDHESIDALVPWSRYVVQGNDTFIRNRAQLRLHGDSGELLSVVDVKEPIDRPRLPIRIRGLEDGRLFWWRGAWHAAVCVVDSTPDEVYQMALVRIEGDRYVDYQPLLGPWRGLDEKNWMPFVVDDRLLFVYGCSPFVVLEWDPEFLELREVQRVPTPPVMADLRGGSQGLPHEGGHLFFVHEKRASKSNMLYVHRLLLTDETHLPVALSPAFVLHRYGIEFCAGLAAWGDDLLFSYGVQDRTAWLSVAGRQELVSLLEPIDYGLTITPEPSPLRRTAVRQWW